MDYSDDRGLTVLAVTPGGPAAQGGVVPGELITAVDGTSLRGNNTAGPSLIQGEPDGRGCNGGGSWGEPPFFQIGE